MPWRLLETEVPGTGRVTKREATPRLTIADLATPVAVVAVFPVVGVLVSMPAGIAASTVAALIVRVWKPIPTVRRCEPPG